MAATTLTVESKTIDVEPSIRWHTPRSDRVSIFKAAELAFGDSVLDCALMDVSPGGARAHLFEEAEVPEVASLRLRDGESWTVRRRWQNGVEIGFAIVDRNAPASNG